LVGHPAHPDEWSGDTKLRQQGRHKASKTTAMATKTLPKDASEPARGVPGRRSSFLPAAPAAKRRPVKAPRMLGWSAALPGNGFLRCARALKTLRGRSRFEARRGRSRRAGSCRGRGERRG
jgi:hypothetical protein